MKIFITGATGFIGLPLTRTLSRKGHQVVALSRSPKRAREKLGESITILQGDLENSTPDLTRLGQLDAVIHLAGENLSSGRWSQATKDHILRSRVLGTSNLVDALNRLKTPPRVFISASAVGFYGSRGDELLTEKSEPGENFLASVCAQWEAATEKLPPETRQLILRLGVILGSGGGAMEKLLPPFRAGAGGKIGEGKQWMSWLHREDLIRVIQTALEDSRYQGVINAVAPEPVRNITFTANLGTVLHRPTLMTVPAFALKLLYGQMAEETILASQRVEPARLKSLGFKYSYPSLAGALSAILDTRPNEVRAEQR